MNEIWLATQGAMAVVGGFLGWYQGGIDGALYALIAFVAIDYLTGLMCAIADKKLSSHAGFSVIAQKVLIFVLVGVGHVVDAYIIGEGSALRMAVVFFYLSNEGLSILENAAYLGLPFPEKLVEVLAKLNKKKDEDSDGV